MKKHILYLLAAGFALLSNVAFTSCSDDDEANANDVLAVKSVLPIKVMEGQVVTITGTGLEKATSVVFPGNVSVSNITKVGNGYISVVTPAGVAAEGGTVTVEAEGESAESPQSLTLGKPEIARVAPLDKEIKINECVEVYGKDLEFISKAYFPGEDGEDIAVDASNFKRKATGSLYIYSPMGIKAGPANVVLEDCSGKRYTLPEVTLSDEVAGGSDASYEKYVPVWKGENPVNTWDDWQYLGSDQFDLTGISLHEGLMIRFTIDNPNGCSFCVCDGGWGAPNVSGSGENTIWVEAGTTTVEFPMSQGMVDTFNGGSGIIVGGAGFVLKTIEIFREYPTLWSGEHETGWWWYMPYTDLDLSAITPEAGQTIRFCFKEHTQAQTFCLCDGWWGAPLIREEEGRDPNNVAIKADENFIDFTISEGMAATMNGGAENCFIIGGEVVITKIQIIVSE